MKLLTKIVAFMAVFLMVDNVQANENMQYCMNEIVTVENNNENVENKIAYLKSLRAKCAGTGLYEYNLGKLYIETRAYDEAMSAFENGLKFSSEYEKELYLSLGDVYLHQHNYPSAEKHYRNVVKKYPAWYGGYHYLGFSLFAQAEYEKAVGSLEKANHLHERWITYRHLVLCYSSLGLYEKSVEALKSSFKLNITVATDRDAMIAGSRSYAELSRFKLSMRTLTLLMSKKPEIIDDEEFIKAGLFLQEKMTLAGLTQ